MGPVWRSASLARDNPSLCSGLGSRAFLHVLDAGFLAAGFYIWRCALGREQKAHNLRFVPILNPGCDDEAAEFDFPVCIRTPFLRADFVPEFCAPVIESREFLGFGENGAGAFHGRWLGVGFFHWYGDFAKASSGG